MAADSHAGDELQRKTDIMSTPDLLPHTLQNCMPLDRGGGLPFRPQTPVPFQIPQNSPWLLQSPVLHQCSSEDSLRANGLKSWW